MQLPPTISAQKDRGGGGIRIQNVPNGVPVMEPNVEWCEGPANPHILGPKLRTDSDRWPVLLLKRPGVGPLRSRTDQKRPNTAQDDRNRCETPIQAVPSRFDALSVTTDVQVEHFGP